MIVSGKIFRDGFIRDYKFAGAKTLSSTIHNAITKLDGTPASVPVFILEASNFELAYFIFSNADGTWEVPNVTDKFQYLAIARDTTQTLNSAAVDWMTPQT